MKRRNLLVIVRSGLDRHLYAREAIDAALVCAAFDMDVSVMFEGDGAEFLHPPHFDKLFESGSRDEFARIFTCTPAPQAHIEALSIEQAMHMLGAHQHIFVV